jgi:YVTN family beta-propeller protein
MLNEPSGQLSVPNRYKTVGALILLIALAAARALCQHVGPASSAGALPERPNAKPTVLGSLNLTNCGKDFNSPCTWYLVEVLEYRRTNKPPTELTVTDIARDKVIFVDDDVAYPVCMIPLDPQDGLLATSWRAPTSGGFAKVYQFNGDSVKVVFREPSKFPTQFIQSDGTSSPFVLINHGREMRGDMILPTVTDIWQWDPTAGKFTLRADVPITQKYASLARVVGEKVNLVMEPAVTATVRVGDGPRAVAVNSATNKIYVVNGGSDNLTVIDGLTNQTKTISNPRAGSNPGLGGVAVNPVTNRIYATNLFADNVTVIDGSADEVIATVATGHTPGAVAVNPRTDRIYVANSGGSSVSVIDGSTNKVLGTVSVGLDPSAVVVNPVSNRIYVANGNFSGGSGILTAIDGSTSKVIATFAAAGNPGAMAINAATGRIYLAAAHLGESGTIMMFDERNGSAKTITLASRDFPVLESSVAVNPVTNTVFAVSENANSMTAIDGLTGRIIATLGVGPTPSDVAVNPTTNRVYVANYDSNTVTVIDGAAVKADPR